MHAEFLDHFNRHDAGPIAGMHMGKQRNHRITFQSRANLCPGFGQMLIDNPPVLHIGRQQTQRKFRRLAPCNAFPVPDMIEIRCHQMITFVIKRDRRHPPQRLVIQIGNPDVNLKVIQQGLNFDRGPRQHRKSHIRVLFAKRGGQFMHHRQCGRNNRDLHLTGQAKTHRAHFIAHRPRTAHNMTRPFQNTFAFGR